MQGSDDLKLVLPGHTIFKIGSEDVSVPPISFWLSEVLDPEMSSINPGIAHGKYVNTVLKIVATCIETHNAGPDKDPDQAQIEQTVNYLKRRISVSEALGLYDTLTELYRNSGFPMAEPAKVPQEGSNPNGALTESAPTSPLEGFARATPSESNVH